MIGRGRVHAVLGPTNTGKTHRAITRMLSHQTGIFGVPLRLLAREVYDRVVAQVGAEAVALVTGEERIVPAEARYFICTVESMPMDRPAAFVGVDEIQLAGHRERGHTFTDRILRARGVRETLLLGADTIEPLLVRLVPGIEITRYQRHSELRWSGAKRLATLPRRAAVVAFSAAHVYRLAERLRARRGGAAVVLGALSPRTRNAQVAMYQAGEVSHLVATDAIGMGLNMDLDHVALAALGKFDGREHRDLSAAELAQIAGRAGRWKRHGTFGTTDGVGELAPRMVQAIEAHDFPVQRALYYRNAELDLYSLDGLLRSLDQPPPQRFLLPKRDAQDHQAVAALAQVDPVRRRARGVDAISLLWDVCRVPDFRKTLTDSHHTMLERLYLDLSGPAGVLDEDWVAERIGALDRDHGDLDALMTRIAWTRTWTYISHRPGWLGDAKGWQGRTRALEDRLSDALHARLTARFVDRKAMALVGGEAPVVAAMTQDGVIEAQGHVLGRLDGFTLTLAPGTSTKGQKAARRAARDVVATRVAAQLDGLVQAPDDAFQVTADGRVLHGQVVLGCWIRGRNLLEPGLRLAPLALLEGRDRDRIRARLEALRRDWVEGLFAPLAQPAASKLGPPARGLLHELRGGLGNLPRPQLERRIHELPDADRKRLAALGVRLGRHGVFALALLRPEALARRALLWGLFHGLDPLPPPPQAGRVMVPVEPDRPVAWYPAVGFAPLGEVALRLDVLERVSASLRRAGRKGPFTPPDEILSWAGLSRDQVPGVVTELGWRVDGDGLVRRQRRRR